MKWFALAVTLAVWVVLGVAAQVEEGAEEVAPPVWSTWKDGDKRAWLTANGILSPSVQLEEDEQGPQGLTNLLEKYYFDEDETVYNSWSDRELSIWLISREFLPRTSAHTLPRASLLSLLEKNYLSSELSSCHGWTPSEARSWLAENGHAEEGEQADDKSVFEVMMKYFDKGSDALAEFMVWPDARLRAWLRARGVSEPKNVKRQRPDLVHMVRVRSAQKKVSTEDLVRRLRDVLDSGAEWSEEQLVSCLAILGGTKHRGVGKGMREASKFARPSDMKEKRIKEEEARLKEEEARLKEEIPEIQRDEL